MRHNLRASIKEPLNFDIHTNIVYIMEMWIKLLYFGLIISSETLGQRKIPTPRSLLKECYSGPIVWTNCRVPGMNQTFPAVGPGIT